MRITFVEESASILHHRSHWINIILTEGQHQQKKCDADPGGVGVGGHLGVTLEG